MTVLPTPISTKRTFIHQTHPRFWAKSPRPGSSLWQTRGYTASAHQPHQPASPLFERRRLTERMSRGRVSVKGGIPPFFATQFPVKISKASYEVSVESLVLQRTWRLRCTHLSIPVEKVVLDISHDGIDAILGHSLSGPLASSGEIGLEGAGAGICARDGVSVVCPY